MSEIAPEPVRWLWEGRVPLGKLAILQGEPGVGKTTLMLDLAARVSRGDEMPVEHRKHGAAPGSVVIYAGGDDLADTVRPRLEAAGADLTRVYAVCREITPEAVAPLQPRLIILDPFSDYLGVVDDRDPVAAVRRVARLAKRTGAAVLATRCSSEADEFAPEFYGTPRSILTLTPLGLSGRKLTLTKSNLEHIPDVHPLVYYFDDEGGQVRIVNWSDGR